MHCFFIDESGLPRLDKITPSSPYFIMGGVIIDDKNYAETKKAIADFKSTHINHLKNYAGIKLHAAALFNCRDEFSEFTKKEATHIGTEFYKLIAKTTLTIVVVAIHKQKLLDRYQEKAQDPYPLAWLYCCDKYNRFLSSKKEEFGNTILEQRGPGLDKLYKERLDYYLSMGTKYRELYRVQKPEFKNAAQAPPLEMADFACYAIHKKINKAEEEYFNIIKHKFYGNGTKYDGYGLVVFPK